MKKLKSILLIDDDHSTNVYHTVIIRKSQITDQIQTIEMPELALDHLQNASKFQDQGVYRQFCMPDLIFLDVNMPRMTGWEFLLEYQKFHNSIKMQPVLYMLTTFLNPVEEGKCLSFDFVKGILSKPLTSETLQEIFQKHFA